jgi:hypothetical protein
MNNIKMILSVNWIGLAQDRDKLRALVNRYLTFELHKMPGSFERLHNWWHLE